MVITIQDRARGVLAGLAVGDALGGPTEGKTATEIEKRWGRVDDFLSETQTWSDDTEYALLCARMLLEYGRNLSTETVTSTYRRDIIDGVNEFKGAGFSEIMAIDNLNAGLMPPESGRHLHSWSDGLAMRVAPYGIASAGDCAFAAHLATEDGRVTQAGEGIYSGRVVAAAVAAAMDGALLDEIVGRALNVIPIDSWTARSVRRATVIGWSAANVGEAIPELAREIPCTAYYWSDLAPEAVGLAFGVVAAARADFREAVLGGVNVGRDTDTVAAIAGAICGAMHGVAAIPEAWLARMGRAEGRCIRTVRGMDVFETADALALLAEDWKRR
jgi:ADP-ribosylglycohydrolase